MVGRCQLKQMGCGTTLNAMQTHCALYVANGLSNHLPYSTPETIKTLTIARNAEHSQGGSNDCTTRFIQKVAQFRGAI